MLCVWVVSREMDNLCCCHMAGKSCIDLVCTWRSEHFHWPVVFPRCHTFSFKAIYKSSIYKSTTAQTSQPWNPNGSREPAKCKSGTSPHPVFFTNCQQLGLNCRPAWHQGHHCANRAQELPAMGTAGSWDVRWLTLRTGKTLQLLLRWLTVCKSS